MATITSTGGNDNLNGGSGADIINGGDGNDKISGGSGSDTLDGGSGNDIVNGDSGNDILVYRLSENSGSSDVYTGGSGIDTIRLMLTNDEWLNASVQTQIGQYLQHLAAVTNAKTMEVSNGSASDFTFNFICVTGTKTTLTIQMTEKLDVWVNGAQIDFHRINITSGEQKGAVVEDAVSAANGTIFFTDVDLAQNHTATAAAAAGNTTTLGTFTTVPVIEGANAANGSVGWSYTLDNAKAQYLAAGQTVTETYTVTVRDDADLTTTQNVVITITGTNDIATVSSESKALTEGNAAAAISTSGKLSISDVDTGEAHVVAQAATAGMYGTFAIDANGAWTYTAGSAHDELSAGQVVTEVFTVKSQDGTGTGKVTITITGTNDGPVAVADVASGTENATLTINVLANDTDKDDGHVFTLVSGMAPQNKGVASVEGNKLVFTPGTDFDHLAAGAKETVVVSYTMADEHGAQSTSTVTITVTGTNDVPTVAAALTAAADEDDASITVDLLAGAADVDDNAVLTVQNVTGLVAGVTVAGNTLTVNPADAAFQHLAAGVEQQITVTYEVADEHGATVAQTATITVTGTNDVPTVAAALTAAADEDDASFTVNLLEGAADADDEAVLTVQNVTGLVAGVTVVGSTLTVNPADAAFQHLAAGVEQQITVNYEVVDEHGATVAQTATITVTGTNDVPTVAAALTAAADEDDASFTVDLLEGAADADDNAVLTVQNVTGLVAGVTVSGNTLTVNPADAAFQHLAAGVEQQITVTYEVADEHGATVAQTATITVTGTNDVPTVAAALTAAADEDDASITVDLLEGAADADDNAVLTVQNVTGLVAGVTVAGNTLTVNPADAAFQHLAAGVEQQITVTYEVADEHGATVAQTATITVTGTNDVPTVAAALTAAADEDDASITVDLLAGAADVDDNAVLTVQNVTGLVAGVTVAGNTLTVNPADAAFQHLAAGVEQQITVTYEVADEHGATVAQTATITVTGTNDVPTVAAALTAAADEDDASFTVNLLEGAADADDEAVLTVQNVTGLVAGVTVVGSTLTVNPADAAFQHLAAGVEQQITVNYEVVDEHGATVAQTATITVTGTNDVPTVAAALTAAADEDDASFTVDLLEGAADADDNAVLTVQNVTGLVAGVTVSGNTLTVNPADAAFQHLAAGVEQQITVTYEVADEHGATVAQTATITVTGTNDVPTVAAALTAAADEDDASITVDLLAGAADVDDNAVLTVQNVTGLVAGVTVAGNTLTVNPADAAFQHLAAGVEQQITVTYEVADEHGATVAQTATITVTGTNDVPTVAAALTAAADEDDASFTVNLLEGAADADDEAVLTVQNVTGLVAGVTVVGSTLTVNPADAAFQHLAAGVEQQITVNYEVVDEHGATVAQTATITVTGTNDVPTVAAALTAAADEDDASFTVDLLEGAADADDNAVLTVQNVTGLVAGVTVSGNTLTVNPADAAFQHLAAGVEQQITVTYEVADEHGATVAQTATITVTGTNDVPTVAAALTAAADEDDASITVDLLEGAADADDNAVLTVQNVTGLVAGVTVAGNTLTVNPADAAFQHLAAGVEQQITVTYEVADEHGATVAQTATITVTGTNDGPVAVADTAAGTENQTLSIDVLANDTDADDGHAFTLLSGTAPTGKGTVAVADGKLVFNPGTAFDHLAAGVTETVTLNYTMKDDQNAQSSSTVTVTITGTNDGPVAVADTASGTENQTLTIDVLANDTDADDNHSFTLLSGSAPTGKGSASIVDGKLVFNPGTAFDRLAAGVTEVVTLNYTMKDDQNAESSSTVTVTITGTNDVAVIGGVSTATVTEDATTPNLTTSGMLTINDVDQGQSSFAAQSSAVGTYGNFTLAANGAWSYTANNSQTAIQQLGAGQSIAESFTAVSSDGTASQVVRVTINGTNDVPVIGGVSTGAVTEDVALNNGNLVTAGALSITDADQGQSSFAVQGNAAGTYGSFTLAANGAWTYTAANSQAAIQQLNQGQSLTDSFTAVSSDGSKSQVVTVSINGTNDVTNSAPTNITLKAAAVGDALPVDNATIATLSTTDANIGDTHTYSLVGAADIFAISGNNLVLTENLDNNSTHTVQIKTTDSAGASYTETFNVIAGSGNPNTLPGSGTGLNTDDVLYGFNNADIMYGGTGDDALFGQDGADTLYGGAGKDTLSGGNDSDTFVFNTALDASTNVDIITDFVSGTDKIYLENTGSGLFNALTTGGLNANAFDIVGSGPAASASTRIIYDPSTGGLSYDADGTGAGAAVQFATLGTEGTHPSTLSNTDFTVI